ncbi:hypothetical protein Bca101_027052 [Brassica carinata]
MAKQTEVITWQAPSRLLFSRVSPGPADSKLQFRLIHFWEARKNLKGGGSILIGIEMLMIDEEGFIAKNRVDRYEKELQAGRIYTLTNYFASNTKVMYRVVEQKLLKDGPVMNVYLWDQAAESFRIKFDASAATPNVLLVTTVNPKRLGRKLCLSSMSSSRVFLDQDVDPTKEYLNWLSANPDAASTTNPAEVVKFETLTICEIAAFIKRQPAKQFSFFAPSLWISFTSYLHQLSSYSFAKHTTFPVLHLGACK